MTIYTSKAYLKRFYDLNPNYRVNSPAAVKLWRKLDEGTRKRIYKSITKGIKVNAYDYLKENLNTQDSAYLKIRGK